jgi:hypothetical protein
MRTLTVLLSLLCLGMAIYIFATPQGGSLDHFVDPANFYTTQGEALGDDGPPLRDADGTILPLDPDEDLAGFIRDADKPLVLPVSNSERNIHLIELYGQRTVDQLRMELEVLRAHFETERNRAFALQFSLGHFKTSLLDQALQAKVPPRLNGSPSLTESRSSTDPQTQAEVTSVVTLHQADHAELYELQDTINWLDARVSPDRR